MKRTLLASVFVCLLILIACQKGISWNLPSEGILTKDVNGDCMPITASGNFIIHKSANDSNFLTVNVDVIAAGTYTIVSDSINGYSFKASGTFDKKGTASIKLPCTGTPLVAETDHFTIFYNNSVCKASVTVQTDTVAAAHYTLQGSPGRCMNDTIKGSYIQTVALDTSDKVIITVNVVALGSYSIFTNTVNGYSFSASGVFTVAGLQTVALSGTGVPAAAGSNLFTIAAGSDNCSFLVNVADLVAVNNPDHFPLTAGSNWTYDDLTNPGDSIVRRIDGDSIINMLSYSIMSEQKKYSSSRYYFSRSGNNYFEYGRVDKYTGSFQYGTDLDSLLPFLNEYMPAGGSWGSGEFRGTASFGQIIYLNYFYTCLNNNATITLNGKGFKDVYKIAVYPELRSENNAWGSTGEVYYYYYAKGIGLIYLEGGSYNFSQPKMQIRNWHVN